MNKLNKDYNDVLS